MVRLAIAKWYHWWSWGGYCWGFDIIVIIVVIIIGIVAAIIIGIVAVIIIGIVVVINVIFATILLFTLSLIVFYCRG